MSSSSGLSTPAELASSKSSGNPSSDHLVKLGPDVYLLEPEEPVKHDSKDPNVGLSVLRMCNIS